MTLGLKRSTVKLLPHQAEWIKLAHELILSIRPVTGHLLTDIQHVGSTSVPDLPAKPILDLVGALKSNNEIALLIDALTPLDFIYRGFDSKSKDHLFVKEKAENLRTVHFHVVLENSLHWSNYLFFRDSLRQSTPLRQAYANLKLNLAKEHADNRKMYTASKHSFIQGILSKIPTENTLKTES